MSHTKTEKFYVKLGAAQARRRLRGHGYGVRRIETAGKNRCVITHTATGDHLLGLRALFRDAIDPDHETEREA